MKFRFCICTNFLIRYFGLPVRLVGEHLCRHYRDLFCRRGRRYPWNSDHFETTDTADRPRKFHEIQSELNIFLIRWRGLRMRGASPLRHFSMTWLCFYSHCGEGYRNDTCERSRHLQLRRYGRKSWQLNPSPPVCCSDNWVEIQLSAWLMLNHKNWRYVWI